MTPQRSDRLAAWWRSFAVQGSWNYRTLLGCGIAYSMLPLLRRIYAGDPVTLRAAVRRHMGSFNAHPYLCAMAVGALARLEHDGVGSETVERFRTALRGPLGALGDRVVWAEWRPLCLLTTIVAFVLGLGPIASVALFLILYNAGHVYVRTWAFREGWRAGLDVGGVLRSCWLERLMGKMWPANLLLLGVVAVLLAPAALERLGAGPVPWTLIAGVPLIAVLAFRWPKLGGRLGAAAVLSLPFVWLVWSLGSW